MYQGFDELGPEVLPHPTTEELEDIIEATPQEQIVALRKKQMTSDFTPEDGRLLVALEAQLEHQHGKLSQEEYAQYLSLSREQTRDASLWTPEKSMMFSQLQKRLDKFGHSS